MGLRFCCKELGG